MLSLVWLILFGSIQAQVQNNASNLCTNLDNVIDPCSYLLNFCPNNNDLVDFRKLYYCSLNRSASMMSVFSILSIFFCFYALYYCSEYYLSVPLQRLILAINMDSQVAGVTLLSLANGAPDFFTTLAGSSQDGGSGGEGIPLIIGSLLGSGLFTTCLAMGVAILFSRPSKEPQEIKEPDIRTSESDILETIERPHWSDIYSIKTKRKMNIKDHSWIVLPRGYFINLLVYNLGLVLLIAMSVSRQIDALYPILQYILYMAYIIYSLFPKICGAWRQFCLKFGFTKESQPSSLIRNSNATTVPTVIVTCPETEPLNEITVSSQIIDSEIVNKPDINSHLKATPLPPSFLGTTKLPSSQQFHFEISNNSNSTNPSSEFELELEKNSDPSFKPSKIEPTIPKIILPEAQDASISDRGLKKELPVDSILVASSSMSLTVPSAERFSQLRRSPPPLPRLSISLSPASTAQLPLSQQLVHTAPTLKHDLSPGPSFDQSRILTYYGFQDPESEEFYKIILRKTFPFCFNKELGLYNRAWEIAMLPIVLPLQLSILPTLEVWTQVDRGEEDWEPNELFFKPTDSLEHNTADGKPASNARKHLLHTLFDTLPTAWYLKLFSQPRTLTSNRIFICRQLVALTPASLTGFRWFSGVTFPFLGSLSALVNGVGFQVTLGLPGILLGFLLGLTITLLSFCLSSFLVKASEQYRESLSQFLVRDNSDSITRLSPLNIGEYFSPFSADGTDNKNPKKSGTVTPDSLNYDSQPEKDQEKLSPSTSALNPCPPPPPSPLLKRVPSWAATFDALGRRSHSGSIHRRNSYTDSNHLETSNNTSSISIAPNYRLQAFIKASPELDLRVLDLVATYNLILLVIGLAITIMYINALSGMLVSLLTTLAELLHLPTALVGMTVLAWGNSISDFVSAIGMARGGHPKIALTSLLAGPIFNLLLTFGTSLVNVISRFPSVSFPSLPPICFAAMGFLILNALLILVGATPLRSNRRPGLTYLPFFQIFNFVLFLGTIVVVQILLPV